MDSTQMRSFLGIALTVRRIETGVAQVLPAGDVDGLAALIRALLIDDPGLAQKALRLACGMSKATLAGLVEAVSHETEEGCEECAAKINGAIDALREVIGVERTGQLIEVTQKAAKEYIEEAGGDIEKAVRRAAAQVAGQTEPDPEDIDAPTVFGTGQKKKAYLN